MRAGGEIAVFSDEDIIYEDGYEEKIEKAFRQYEPHWFIITAPVLIFIRLANARTS